MTTALVVGGIGGACAGWFRARGAAVVTSRALPLLADGGSVVLFSSVNGRHGGNELSGPACAVAKAGIIGLTRHLAKHQARRRIRVNCLAPGPVATPMLDRLTDEELAALRATIPLDHVTTADEIAETVGWLCSPAARCPKWSGKPP